MRILHVKSMIPTAGRSGTDIVSLNLLRLLSRDHDVTFLGLAHSAADREQAEELGGICREVVAVPAPNKRSIAHRAAYKALNLLKLLFLLRSPQVSYNAPGALRRELERLLERETFDLVLIEYWYDAALRSSIRGRAPSTLLIHDAAFVNDARRLRVEQQAFRRAAMRLFFRFKRWEELRAIASFDRVLAISEADVRAIRRAGPALEGVRFRILPLSIVSGPDDIAEVTDADAGADRSLYFIGGLGRINNADAVAWFLDEIRPHLERRVGPVDFTVLGGVSARLRRRLEAKGRIRFTGFVEDAAAHVRSFRVCVAPLRIGSGVKIKILDAFVQGRPVVTTSVGAEGIGFFEENPSAVQDDPRGFAEEVARLLTDPGHLRRVREGQRRWALEHLTIEANRERVGRTLELVAGHGGGR
jgi:glycosyltransferase involved in cell wall biosynthesis